MDTTFLWLELTGRCQLECGHCYADSGPTRGHGAMTTEDWQRVIQEAAEAGVRVVQLIGGEPTQHPGFADLLGTVIDTGLRAEVYTNLMAVRESWWDLLAHPNVSVATSYYSDQAPEHERITGRRGSHGRTRANIAEAVRREIPVRVGIIDVLDGQRVEQARADLAELGVTRVGTDRMRGIGRGAGAGMIPNAAELCGNCGRGRAAVLPNGDVTPCIMARWMVAGNIREQGLAEILSGDKIASLAAEVPRWTAVCAPDCKPGLDGNDCEPAERTACKPDLLKDIPNKPLPNDAPTPAERPARRDPAPARPGRRMRAESDDAE